MGLNIDKKWIISGAVAIAAIVIIVVIVVVVKKKKSETVEGFVINGVSKNVPVQNEVNKERFTIALGANSTADAVGSVTGRMIGTTGTTQGNAEEKLMKTGSYDYTDNVAFGVDLPKVEENMNPFDKQLKLHQQTLDIAERNNGMPSHEDHRQIAENVHSGNTGDVNIYKRGLKKSLKMKIDPLGVQGVIDEKYLPERERHGDLRVVGTVIPIKGYDINVERMGESMKGISWSRVRAESLKEAEGVIKGELKGGLNLNESDMIADVNRSMEEGMEMDVSENFRTGFVRGARMV